MARPCPLSSVLLVVALATAWPEGDCAALVAGNLWQYQNGRCQGLPEDAWASGNVNATHAFWREGESVPFRLVITGLAAGNHTATIGLATTVGGYHAFDYLTTFNRTAGAANPCAGVPGCPGTVSTASIPTDPNVVSFGVQPISGDFVSHGGTITGASPYSLMGGYGGDSETQITISFTTSAPQDTTVVLSWGAHVATRADWANLTAHDLPGSPYQVMMVAVDGGGGQQLRTLSAGAVSGAPPIGSTVSSNSIDPGQSVTDAVAMPTDANGTVRFYVCGPNPTAPDCHSGGIQVGTAKTTLSGNVTSDPFAPTASGRYSFRVEYEPDIASSCTYTSASHTNVTTESFQVTGSLGVGDAPSATAFLVAPNPGRSEVKIVCPAGVGPRLVEIMDLGGRALRRLAHQADSGAATVQWDLRDGQGRRVRNGLYWIRIVNQDGSSITRCIAVVR